MPLNALSKFEGQIAGPWLRAGRRWTRTKGTLAPVHTAFQMRQESKLKLILAITVPSTTCLVPSTTAKAPIPNF